MKFDFEGGDVTMDFFVDVVKLTASFVVSIVFIIAVLRFLTKITEPFFEWIERKSTK